MAAMSRTRSARSSVLLIGAVAGIASGLGALLAGMLFLSALFSQSHVLGRAALVALAIGLLGSAVARGSQAYLLSETGSWTTLGGRPASRSEQPAWFVTWVTLHGLLATTYGVAAAFMVWIAISPATEVR
jgi:hypothetical protein